VNPPQGIALPPSLVAHPRPGDWLRVLPAGVIEVRPGKVELGQGVLTALAQVAAEELDVSLARVRMMPAVTGLSPDEGYTWGSLSVQYSGAVLRLICAEARGRFLAAAAARLGVPEDKLTVADGQILAPNGRASSYWELAGAGLLDQPATGGYQPKPASAYRVVGASLPRLDLPDKLTGRPRYTHDLSPDGLCHGRIVRPPSRAATLAHLDPAAALALPACSRWSGTEASSAWSPSARRSRCAPPTGCAPAPAGSAVRPCRTPRTCRTSCARPPPRPLCWPSAAALLLPAGSPRRSRQRTTGPAAHRGTRPRRHAD